MEFHAPVRPVEAESRWGRPVTQGYATLHPGLSTSMPSAWLHANPGGLVSRPARDARLSPE